MNRTQALDILRDHIRLRHLSLSTERTYTQWARRYIDFLRDRPSLAAEASHAKISAFLTSLAHRHPSASSQNQALSALVFFYKNALGRDPGPIADRGKPARYTRGIPGVRRI